MGKILRIKYWKIIVQQQQIELNYPEGLVREFSILESKAHDCSSPGGVVGDIDVTCRRFVSRDWNFSRRALTSLSLGLLLPVTVYDFRQKRAHNRPARRRGTPSREVVDEEAGVTSHRDLERRRLLGLSGDLMDVCRTLSAGAISAALALATAGATCGGEAGACMASRWLGKSTDSLEAARRRCGGTRRVAREESSACATSSAHVLGVGEMS